MGIQAIGIEQQGDLRGPRQLTRKPESLVVPSQART